MTREEVVRISKSSVFGGLTEMDVNTILMNYCLEHGKPHYETTVFITALLRSRIFEPFFMEALEYYEKKYNINKLQGAPDRMNYRKTILIY